MRISVFGLGYVGSVTAGCLAEMGHTVVGVEPNQTKVDMLNRGQSPIVEAQLEEMLKKFVASGQISATSDWAAAIAQTELAIVCVGTPSLESGNIDLSHVRRAAEQIGLALRDKKDYFRVVIRSTVLTEGDGLTTWKVPLMRPSSLWKRIRTPIPADVR